MGDRVGVAEEALGGVEDHVLGGLGGAGVVEGEGGREVRMGAGVRGRGRGREGVDRLARLGGGGERRRRQQAAATRSAARRARRGAGPAALWVCGLIVSLSLLICVLFRASAMAVGLVVALMVLALPHASALLPDISRLACCGWKVIATAAGDAPDGRRRRGRRAGPVALVGGLALDGGRNLGEAAAGAGVVDLHPVAVVVRRDQGVAGEEVGVGAVGADTEQARVEGAGAGRDQLDPLAALPLVGVLLVVEVAVDQPFGRVEEDAAVVGEARGRWRPGSPRRSPARRSGCRRRSRACRTARRSGRPRGGRRCRSRSAAGSR